MPAAARRVEEPGEGVVVSLERGDVSGLARAEGLGAGRRVVVVSVRDVGEGDGHAALLHGRDVGERHGRRHAVEPGEPDVAGGVADHRAGEVRERPARADLGRHVSVPEEAGEARVPARLVGQEVRLAVVRRGAEGTALRAVDGNADEVGRRLHGVRRDEGGLGGAGAEHLRHVRPDVLEHGVRRRHHPDVAACSGIGHPRRRGDLAELVDHLRRGVGLRPRVARVEQRVRPVREGDAGIGRPVRVEIAEAVGDRLTHPVAVDAGQRREDACGGVGDEHGMVVGEKRAVFPDEVEQVRHLLHIRRHVRVVPPEVRVVELDVDNVLNAADRGAELARGLGRGGGARQGDSS